MLLPHTLGNCTVLVVLIISSLQTLHFILNSDRTQISTKLFRNLGRAKSELEFVETEKTVFDCIQTGEIPNWIKRDCLYVALAGEKSFHQFRDG